MDVQDQHEDVEHVVFNKVVDIRLIWNSHLPCVQFGKQTELRC